MIELEVPGADVDAFFQNGEVAATKASPTLLPERLRAAPRRGSAQPHRARPLRRDARARSSRCASGARA